MTLRLDDIGAASKLYETWSRHWSTNWWPMNLRYFAGQMAPYRELTPYELETILHTVAVAHRSITLAITAYWVKRNGSLMAYNRKFPGQAAVVAQYARRGVVEVAAHGMTHCVPGFHRPRWIGSNRYWHRDRSPWRQEAKRAIEAWLDLPVTRFVEPGEIAPFPPREEIFHDREFVLDWARAMKRLSACLR